MRNWSKLSTFFLALGSGWVSAVDLTTSLNLPDPLAAGWLGKSVCQKLHENEKQRVLKCRFPPGVGHTRHYHVKHFGYALSGGTMRLTDQTGVREVKLNTGSSYYSEGTPWHEVLNIGETTVEYLIVEAK